MKTVKSVLTASVLLSLTGCMSFGSPSAVPTFTSPAQLTPVSAAKAPATTPAAAPASATKEAPQDGRGTAAMAG